MSRMWSAKNAVRAQRLRLVDNDVPGVSIDPYAAGYAAARMTAATELDAERTMLLRLIEAAASIAPTDPEPLATMLAETVLRLVEDVSGVASVDQPLLRERALALAEAIHGPDGPVVLRVHPDCVAMLDGLRADICVCGDPTVNPGQIVMRVGDGTAEDGVTSALDRVRAALGMIS
jgi:flagellar assembly protein FliH